MKNLFTTLIIIISAATYAQDFTWVRGSTSNSIAGTYGTQGVSAPGNDPGGRHGCAQWVDAAGNLWLFGGEGFSTNTTLCWLNDLWKYNITTNQWTWIRGSNGPNAIGVYGTQGVAAPTNEPGAREFSASWTDQAGNFWMFGGDGFGNISTFGRLGDLWKYNPTTNQWTWMNGYTITNQFGIFGTMGTASSSNFPGCRYGAGMCSDANGDFWLFGGRGFGASGFQGYISDLWKYNVSSNQWTWMSGSITTNLNGVYGTLGTPSNTNAPGARYFPTCWSSAGKIQLFGGFGFPISTSTLTIGYENDVWQFDPAVGTWNWLNGANTPNVNGVYGTQQVSSPANVIGSRYAAASWAENTGNLWVFGGTGFATPAIAGELNDLFKYNLSTNQWTWMNGTQLTSANGVYGTQGVSSPTNSPGGRTYNTFWKGTQNKNWLLGGEGFGATGTQESNMNDLWFLSVPCNPDSIVVAPSKIICSGTTVTLTAVNGGTMTSWFNSATGTASVTGGSTYSTTLAANTQTTYSYYVENASCSLPRKSVVITVNPLPTLMLSASRTVTCKFEPPVTVSVTGAASYTWNLIPVLHTTLISVQPSSTTTYSVSGTDTNGCSNSSTITIKVVNDCINGIETLTQSLGYSLFPNPSQGTFILKIESPFREAQLNLFNALGQKVFERTLYTLDTGIAPDLAAGVYFYRLTINGSKDHSGKLIIE